MGSRTVADSARRLAEGGRPSATGCGPPADLSATIADSGAICEDVPGYQPDCGGSVSRAIRCHSAQVAALVPEPPKDAKGAKAEGVHMGRKPTVVPNLAAEAKKRRDTCKGTRRDSSRLQR